MERRSSNLNLIYILAVFLLLAITLISPAKAQVPTAQPVVIVVMFWMEGCPYCHTVLDEVLPPLLEKFGSQLEVNLIEVVTTEDIELLYETAAAYGIPKDRVNVPFLIIGEHVLIGSKQVPDELPGFIEQYLSQGGTEWPVGLAPETVE